MTAADFLRQGISAQDGCPLAPLSSFRIGGTAEVAVFPETAEQLARSLELICMADVPFDVIGNGTDLLLPDGTYRGVLVVTRSMRGVAVEGDCMTALGGTPLPLLAVTAQAHGLSGLEFAQGIPGTLGGGVFMNAGAFGGCMADVTEWSEWYDTESGETGRFCDEAHRFGTRTSVYEQTSRYVLLRAGLRLTRDDPCEIAARMEDYRARRARTQPLELPSAGSVFRHPPGAFAGKLIEDLGLKGTRIGGAEVSRKHAGFIVNQGGATAQDVRDLIGLIRARVLDGTGYRLECEVRTVTDRRSGIYEAL